VRADQAERSSNRFTDCLQLSERNRNNDKAPEAGG
jgi:hypothetical protein